METTTTTTTELFESLSALHMAAIAAALVFLVIGLRLVLKKPPAHLTAFSGQAGSVLVSRKALQELIRQACLLDDWVEAARPIVKLKGPQVQARVELRLARPENLREVTQRIQERITLLLQKSLSFEQIGDIQIVVKSFAESSESTKGGMSPQSGKPDRENEVDPEPEQSADPTLPKDPLERP